MPLQLLCVERKKRQLGLGIVIVWVTLVNSYFSTRITFSRELDFWASSFKSSPAESAVPWDVVVHAGRAPQNVSSSSSSRGEHDESSAIAFFTNNATNHESFARNGNITNHHNNNSIMNDDDDDEDDDDEDERHLQQHPHPYAGAKDAQGHWGYLHNAKFLQQQHPPTFTISLRERAQICAPPGQGPEGDLEAYRFLTEHLQIRNYTDTTSSDNSNSTDAPPPLLHNNDNNNHNGTNNNIQLFCAVYTHAGSRDMTVAAVETWARRCDGFLAASTITNATYGMVHVPHGGDHFGKYFGIWQKVRSMMTYIYQHYGDQYDYFHFNGDDTFLIVENLKAMLLEQRPPYVGMWRSPHWPHQLQESDPDFYYPLGGAGYTLSRDTLRVLVQELLPACETDTDEPHEDYLVARCLWPAGIRAAPYWDETGASRYNPGGVPYYQENFLSNAFWSYSHATLARYYPTILPPFPQTVAQAISNTSVSFHLVQTPALMRRYERLIYRMKDNIDDCRVTPPMSSLRRRHR